MKIMEPFKKMDSKNRGLFRGFLAILAIAIIAISFVAGTRFNSNNEQEVSGGEAVNLSQEEKASNEDKISERDLEEVENMTYEFFAYFKEGIALNDKIFTNITYQYFNKDFLQNDFPKEESKLFGIYGYQKLTNTFTSVDGLIDEGAIKSFEVLDIQQDNYNNAITVYVRMDALYDNTVHWIEWRNIPGEGWKINAVSFDANIESLSSPLTPKREF